MALLINSFYTFCQLVPSAGRNRGLYISPHREVRLHAIIKEILKPDFAVDIIGLQEVWMEEDYNFLASSLSHVLPFSTYFHAGSIGSGLATFSRWPIEGIEFRRYSVSGRPEHIFRGDWFAGKGMGLLRIVHPSGTLINLLSTHMVASYDCSEHGLDSYVSHRVIQAYEYGRFLEALGRDSSSLTVGVGDFNMQPGSIPYRLLLRPGTTIRSAWDGWDEPDTFNHPNNSNAKGKKAPQKIDHIFYINHGNSKVTQRGVVFNQRILYRDISLSDHFGLWTQFEFDPTEPTQMTTSNPTYDSALVADAQSLINAHILDIVFEKKVFYSLVSFFAVLEIAFLLTLLFGGFFSPTLRKEKAIVLCTLFSTALLVATWGFGTCFRAYGFANDELAAHKQFLIEFGTVAKTK